MSAWVRGYEDTDPGGGLVRERNHEIFFHRAATTVKIMQSEQEGLHLRVN